jgi:hypothetical protein
MKYSLKRFNGKVVSKEKGKTRITSFPLWLLQNPKKYKALEK